MKSPRHSLLRWSFMLCVLVSALLFGTWQMSGAQDATPNAAEKLDRLEGCQPIAAHGPGEAGCADGSQLALVFSGKQQSAVVRDRSGDIVGEFTSQVGFVSTEFLAGGGSPDDLAACLKDLPSLDRTRRDQLVVAGFANLDQMIEQARTSEERLQKLSGMSSSDLELCIQRLALRPDRECEAAVRAAGLSELLPAE